MSQEFITIPVPRDRVQDVYDLLARPKGALPSQRTSEQSEAIGADALDAALLTRMYRESPPAMMAFLDYLAANPDRDVPMKELREAVGREPRQMSGMLGAYGRRWKNRYNHGSDAKWPFKAEWDYVNGTAIYSMSTAVAKIIKAAKGKKP